MNKLIFMVLSLSLLLMACSNEKTEFKPINELIEQQETSLEGRKATGSTGSGDVLIELTPHEVVDGLLEVDIAVNTHSVTLEGFDLMQITTLEFNGKTLKPIDAPTLRGHHNSGTLSFEVGEDIDRFTIKIEGIPNVEERTFEWGK